MEENEISKNVLDAAIEVHRTLGGPGLAKEVYAEALSWELQQRGLKVEPQKSVPFVYKGRVLSTPLVLDMLVEDKVIVTCLAAPENLDYFDLQMLTRLRVTGLKLGLVIHFGARRVVDGFKRVVNHL